MPYTLFASKVRSLLAFYISRKKLDSPKLFLATIVTSWLLQSKHEISMVSNGNTSIAAIKCSAGT